MFTVHLRVNDGSTGKPTPVRVRLTGASGTYHPPFGRLAQFSTAPDQDVGGQVMLAGRAFAYVNGVCEVRLPAGEIAIDISKGPEYSPVQRVVHLAAGQISLRQTIERWTDWRELGWYPGDVRAHALSPNAAALEGAAEGLAAVHLLARERPPSAGRPGSLVELLEFSGNVPAVSFEGCAVEVNTLNVHPRLGSVGLLHAHRPVFPLRSGAPGLDDWSVADWCDQCHRKTGLVVWPEVNRTNGGSLQGQALAALVLGQIDAFEVSDLTAPEPDSLTWYYDLLGCGLRPVLVGGSGKESNATALGTVRTYARLDPGAAFSTSAWIGAVRAGRTFVTSGPLLSFRAGEQGPGDTLSCQAGQRLPLTAEVHSTAPFDDLEILAGGEVIASKPASGNRQSTQLHVDYRCERSTWLAARCTGAGPLVTGQPVFAHTSPIWVDVPGQPALPSPETVRLFVEMLAEADAWLAGEARCEGERQRQQMREGIEQARQRLLSGGN